MAIDLVTDKPLNSFFGGLGRLKTSKAKSVLLFTDIGHILNWNSPYNRIMHV
jgi:hypothetical protein